MADMDSLDRKLIALLRRDARRSIVDLALALGCSRATVRARMQALEASGEIVGYTAVLKGDGHELPVRGMTCIAVEGRGADRVVDSLRGFAEVTAIHTTNGRWDLIVELATTDLPSFDAVLRRIRLIPGIANSETSLLLATPHMSRMAARPPLA